ncbi:MAG: alcohol dehydrogenase catalytic domain-containing protein [Planctomycetota bacterium]|nr:alcohol dehydrogenase catalytic domain-containing protein [Planctomycetota bacterium]
MRAMIFESHSPIEAKPLRLTDLPTPTPSDSQILVKVSVCGACHTDLDEIEGRLEPSMLPIVPGQRSPYVAQAGEHPGCGGPERG